MTKIDPEQELIEKFNRETGLGIAVELVEVLRPKGRPREHYWEGWIGHTFTPDGKPLHSLSPMPCHPIHTLEDLLEKLKHLADREKEINQTVKVRI